MTLVRLPRKQTKVELELFKWKGNKWIELSPLTGQIDSTVLIVDRNAIAEGFYKLSVVFDKNDVSGENIFYAVVTADWKKDLLAYCRDNKEQIELNPDAELIFSSIAISHFDHLMEIVSSSSVLSETILEGLVRAINNKKVFEGGRCPDFVRGAFNKLRLKRFEGAKITEFWVYVPEDHNSIKSWPMYLRPDIIRFGVGEIYNKPADMIDVFWFLGSSILSPKEFEWKDYEYFMKVIKDKLNVDEDRIYLYGHCGNGIPAMGLALKYPDQWAECSISMGNSFRYLAGNALNLPLIFTHLPHHDAPNLVGYYDFASKCFLYYNCRYFKYSKIKIIEQVRGSKFPTSTRVRDPNRVLYTLESLSDPKAYWVKIDGRKDENLIGTIDASVDRQKILVKTTNVDAYSLDLSLAPIDSSQPVQIIENGKNSGYITGPIFSKRSEKYKDAFYVKNEYLHGPVGDVFTDSYVVVWGSGGDDKELCGISSEVAEAIANGGPCFSDTNAAEGLIAKNNLILVGTVETNKLLAKIENQLPVKIKDGCVAANGKIYEGRDIGSIIIYPNPINPTRYVSVFSGTSLRVMRKMSDAYVQMKDTQSSDVGIFEVDGQEDIKWLIMEKFNTVWDWHDEWGHVAAVTVKKHPKWQWSQWIAAVVRRQLNVDVAICEAPLKFADSVPAGQITYRDLFNSFRNDWMVKISLDGRSLRNMLNVAFNDISKREVAVPIMDGVSRFKSKQVSENNVLILNELEDEKKYTVALPYKAVNSQRMGVLLEDYEITGEGFLFSLLKDYLRERKRSDIDAVLDGLKVNIF